MGSAYRLDGAHLEMSQFSPVPTTPLDAIVRQFFLVRRSGPSRIFQFVNSLVLTHNFSGSCNSGEEDIALFRRHTRTPRDRERMVKNLRGPFLLATAIAFLVGALMSAEVEASSLSRENGLGWAAAWSACDGTIGECLGGEETEEMAMDSESNRRILLTNQHITYEALKRNSIPCSTNGASYYNCRPGAQANPYTTRSCNDITRCARS